MKILIPSQYDEMKIFNELSKHGEGKIALKFKGRKIIKNCFVQYCEESDIDYLKKVKRELAEIKDNVPPFIKNCNEMNDVAFLKAISKCYTPDEMYFVPSIMNYKYNGAALFTLKTDDTIYYKDSEGHGKDFSWWEVYAERAYKVWANEDTEFEDRIYTKQEIADLVKANKIDIVDISEFAEHSSVSGDYYRQLKRQVELSNQIKINKSIFVDTKWFEDLHKLTDSEIEKFCQDNAFLLPVLHKIINPNRVQKEFEYFPMWFMEGQQRLAREKQTILDNLVNRKETLASNAKKYIENSNKKISSVSNEISEIENIDVTISE